MEENQKNSFGRPVTDIIRERRSVRSYKKEFLPEGTRERLTRYFEELAGPFGAKLRFKLLDRKAEEEDSGAKLGTYGIIRGAVSFITAALEESGHCLEDLGFCFEKLILYATSLGLGTCWMGGTFKRGEFAKAVGLKSGELIPIVTPVGFPAGRMTLIESVMRMGAGSKTRKDWDALFFQGSVGTPLGKEEAGEYAIPLEMVRLAPSASNKQPWRIVREDKSFRFHLSHAVGYGSALGFDIQKIDMGIAMCHFELAAREQGLKGGWKVEDRGPDDKNDGVEYTVSWVVG